MQKRPTWDEYFIDMVNVVATRGTCLRRKVGAIIVDERHVVLATGYNGKAAGLPNCNEQTGCNKHYDDLDKSSIAEPVYGNACSGAYAKSGTNLDGCEAIHAETQCLIFCPDASKIHTLYVSCSPCINCVKMFMQTGCQRIVFVEEYPHSESKRLWEESKPGREWIKFYAE